MALTCRIDSLRDWLGRFTEEGPEGSTRKLARFLEVAAPATAVDFEGAMVDWVSKEFEYVVKIGKKD